MIWKRKLQRRIWLAFVNVCSHKHFLKSSRIWWWLWLLWWWRVPKIRESPILFSLQINYLFPEHFSFTSLCFFFYFYPFFFPWFSFFLPLFLSSFISFFICYFIPLCFVLSSVSGLYLFTLSFSSVPCGRRN